MAWAELIGNSIGLVSDLIIDIVGLGSDLIIDILTLSESWYVFAFPFVVALGLYYYFKKKK